MSCARTLLVALLCLAARTASAAPDPVAAAKQAAESADAYCVEGASGDVQIAANTLIPVGGAWADVDAAWQRSHEPSLLYWRGRLAQCLEKRGRAAEDLTAFIEAMADDPIYVQQVEDARRRLRFLAAAGVATTRHGPGRATVAGATIGVGLGAISGVLGGLAGWQDATARAAVQRYQSGQLRRGEFDAVRAEIDTSGAAANALVGVSAGLLVGAVVAAITTVVLSPKPQREGSRAVSVGPGGAGLELRW